MDKDEICLHWGEEYDKFLGAVVPPLFQTTVFTRKTENHGYSYTRVSNPTIDIAERKLAALEEGEAALLFSSGMAAISAVLMSLLEQGGHVICPSNVYGPTLTFLESYLARFGVETTTVDGTDLGEIEAAIRPETKAIYLESPLSNTFRLQDVRAVAALARSRGIVTVVDNTWATPMFQNPLALGADLVVHSASKYLGGHSDILGGVVVGAKDRLERLAREERGLFGAVMDPHQAWLLIRGLRTLPVRMRRHEESGMRIAAFLASHPLVERVSYPGLRSHPEYELGRRQMAGYSGVMSFVPRGGPERVMPMVKRLRLFEEGPSWGGFESLINTPGLWLDEETSARRGIPRGLVRISVGLESPEALMDDLDQALQFASKTTT
ncbi:MAG TPA: aminotransferase class I/II-fold pyridoxal phosphate-dependent enzyme [Paenibacillus sp.]|nr:aminotransferase class I/II-fold pyridoxal phosphate-dependent enzyme [Paenibacillus sp.]